MMGSFGSQWQHNQSYRQKSGDISSSEPSAPTSLQTLRSSLSAGGGILMFWGLPNDIPLNQRDSNRG